MPAVNHPPQQTEGNVTFASSQTSYRRLISNSDAVAVVLILIAVLCLAIQSRRRDFISRRQAGLADPGVIRQQQRILGLSEKSRGVSNHFNGAMAAKQDSNFSEPEADGSDEKKNDEGDSRWPYGSQEDGDDSEGKQEALEPDVKSRPPPPPPLTPPRLSTGPFNFEERRLSSSVSTMGDLDSSFFHQPNPDYTSPSSSSSTSSGVLHQSHMSSTTPRRRSYTKMLPLGPPEPVGILEDDGQITFAPSSFPSSNHILPLAPHDSFHTHLREIDVKGEIISVMDDAGAGWKRHTRVYGGGVCLACLASGGEGGFYGDRVRPEERR